MMHEASGFGKPCSLASSALLLIFTQAWAQQPGDWVTVLQYAEWPYAVTQDAVGQLLPANTNLINRHTFFAKLADIDINLITDGSQYDYYKLTSFDPPSITPLYLRVERTGANDYADTATSMGIGNSYFSSECTWEDGFDQCEWEPLEGGALDTGFQAGCSRWFTDARPPVDCYNPYDWPTDPSLGLQRCFSRGEECGYSMRTHVTVEKYGFTHFNQTVLTPLGVTISEAEMVLEQEGTFYGGVHSDTYGFAIPLLGRTVLRFPLEPFYGLWAIDLSPWVSGSDAFRGGFVIGDYAYLVPSSDFFPHGRVVRLNMDLNPLSPNGDDVAVWNLADFDSSLQGFWGGFAYMDAGYLVPHNNGEDHGTLLRFSASNFGQAYELLDLRSHHPDAYGFAGGFVRETTILGASSVVGHGILVPYSLDLAVKVDLESFTVAGSARLHYNHFAEGFASDEFDFFLPYMRAGPVARVRSETFDFVELLPVQMQGVSGPQPEFSWSGGFRDEWFGYLLPASGGHIARFPLADFSGTDFFVQAGAEAGGSPAYSHGFVHQGYGYMIPLQGPLARFKATTSEQTAETESGGMTAAEDILEAPYGCALRRLHGGKVCDGPCMPNAGPHADVHTAWDACLLDPACTEVVHDSDGYHMRAVTDPWTCDDCETYVPYCPDPKHQADSEPPLVWDDSDATGEAVTHPVYSVECGVTAFPVHGPTGKLQSELLDYVPQPGDSVYLDRQYVFSALNSFAEMARKSALERDIVIYYLRLSNDMKLSDPKLPLATITAPVPLTVFLDFWGGEEQYAACDIEKYIEGTWVPRPTITGAEFAGQGPGVVYSKEFQPLEEVSVYPCGYVGGLHLVWITARTDDCATVAAATPTPTTASTGHGGDTETPAAAGDVGIEVLIIAMVTLIATLGFSLFLAHTHGSAILGLCRRSGHAQGPGQANENLSASKKLINPSRRSSLFSWVSRESVVMDTFGGMFTQYPSTAMGTKSSLPMPAGKHYHFFVSHKKQHRTYNNTSELTSIYIKDALQVSGLKGFLDIDDLTHITEEDLRRAVRASCTMIVVLSDETVNSEWCRLEWNVAADNGIPTVCIVDMEKFQKRAILQQVADVCPHLMEHQWLDYTYQSRERSMKSLAKWMDSMLKPAKSQQPNHEATVGSAASASSPTVGSAASATSPIPGDVEAGLWAIAPGSLRPEQQPRRPVEADGINDHAQGPEQHFLDRTPSTTVSEASRTPSNVPAIILTAEGTLDRGRRLTSEAASDYGAGCGASVRSVETLGSGQPLADLRLGAGEPEAQKKKRWRRHRARPSEGSAAPAETTAAPRQETSWRAADEARAADDLPVHVGHVMVSVSTSREMATE